MHPYPIKSVGIHSSTGCPRAFGKINQLEDTLRTEDGTNNSIPLVRMDGARAGSNRQ